MVPYEDAEASVVEIQKRAGDKRFAHVMLLSRTAEALGRPRYWPIYQAAVEHGLPIGIHVFGYSGWTATPTGWPSFYIEEMTEHARAARRSITSMIMEGVFERFPTLKIVMIEAGFGWMPALGWRMDKQLEALQAEVPHLKRAPSEYMREHFWVSTQPMEEPEHPARSDRHHGLDRLGPHPVRQRLSALGFRRSGDRAAGESRRRAPSHDQSGNAQALYNFS